MTDVLTRSDRAAVLGQITLSLVALAIAVVLGFAQALDRLAIDIYRWIPGLNQYYQGLTAHGVMNVLVFTFAFSNGFMTLVHARSLQRRPSPVLLWTSLTLAVAGASLALWQIVANEASVLFTMYPPLKASWIYYAGILLLVLGTWATAWNVFATYIGWRREHRGVATPLQAYMVVATYAMWQIASVGVATEVIALLLPWSMGLVPEIDPQLARTLFWFSGHPIVYFWLLPAYVSWYTMIPEQTGGKLFSDPLARLVFLMFLLLSTPTGFHHQYTDPGISPGMKMLHLVLTFGVFFPSMLTAFSVVAALESGGRARGGTGMLGWIGHLRWSDPSFTAQVVAMLGFVFGGISGLINSSYNVNLVVHNTAWVTGHFHLTVGTAVALSFMGISYWLVPHLVGRRLAGRRVALVQAWSWGLGALIFARGQIEGGLDGMPRRLWASQATYGLEGWAWDNALTGIGGTLMFLSAVLYFVVILATVSFGERGVDTPMPIAEATEGATNEWPVLERWGLWIGATVALILIAYLPFFLTYLPAHPISEGMRVW